MAIEMAAPAGVCLGDRVILIIPAVYEAKLS